MSKKVNLGILFGGRSCEHEVSVRSAKSVIQAVDQDKYNLILIGIDKTGRWYLCDDFEQLTDSGSVSPKINLSLPVCLETHDRGNLTESKVADSRSIPALDVIFPILHGTFGEDGTLQGVMEMAGIPYVGCGVAASALAMDKALAKKIFEANNIPQAPYYILNTLEWHQKRKNIIADVEVHLGYPMFVKPANMGSSVGISKALDPKSLALAIEEAFQFDTKIVIEKSMENCHEVECAILGNNDPKASVVGEIIPGADFYNYETKYLDDKSELVIPAKLDDDVVSEIRRLSIAAFKSIDGSGLSRVDFFVDRRSNDVFLNEINTLPGFTPISMYPQLWSASGINYSELIDQLVLLALERHNQKSDLKRTF